MISTALVIGASGLIGSELLERRQQRRNVDFELVGTYYSYKLKDLIFLDYRDKLQVASLLDKWQPQVVLCPAAISNVDWCEEHPGESREVNVKAIEVIAKECARRGTLLVFFSTDYIFNGRDGPYGENSLPNPINVYGKQKLEAENLIRAILGNQHIIIRTTVAYGWEPQEKNFVVRLLKGASQKRRIAVPVDQLGTPTYVPSLADATWELVCNEKFGTWHLAGGELVSRYDFAQLVAKTFDLDSKLVYPVITKDLVQKAKRPLRAGLISGKAGELEAVIPGPIEGLRAMRSECRTQTFGI